MPEQSTTQQHVTSARRGAFPPSFGPLGRRSGRNAIAPVYDLKSTLMRSEPPAGYTELGPGEAHSSAARLNRVLPNVALWLVGLKPLLRALFRGKELDPIGLTNGSGRRMGQAEPN